VCLETPRGTGQFAIVGNTINFPVPFNNLLLLNCQHHLEVLCRWRSVAKWVEFVTGRGGAGFDSPGPPLHGARGIFLGVIPAPSIPLTGARFSPPIFRRPIWGMGGAEGRGREPLKKHVPPQTVQRGGEPGPFMNILEI